MTGDEEDNDVGGVYTASTLFVPLFVIVPGPSKDQLTDKWFPGETLATKFTGEPGRVAPVLAVPLVLVAVRSIPCPIGMERLALAPPPGAGFCSCSVIELLAEIGSAICACKDVGD